MDSQEITLKEYVERLIREMDHRYENRFIAQEQAVKLALEKSHYFAYMLFTILGLVIGVVAMAYRK